MKNSEKTRPASKGNKEKPMNSNRPSSQEKGKENGKSKKQDDGKKKGSPNEKENSSKTFNKEVPLKDPDSTSVEETKNNDPTIPEKKKELYDGKHNQQNEQQKPPVQNEEPEKEEPEEEGEPNPEIFNPQAKKNEAFSGEKKNERHPIETDHKGL